MIKILGPNDPALQALKVSIERNPSIESELTIIEWADYRAKLDGTLASATAEFDAVCIPGHIWLPQLANDRLLQPFEPLHAKMNANILRSYDPADIFQSIQLECQFGGRQYVLPLFTDGHIVFYRGDLVSLPAVVNPSEWPKHLQGHKLPAGMSAFAMKAHASEILLDFLPTFWDLGGELWSEDGKTLFNSPQAVKALEHYTSLRNFCAADTDQYGNGEIVEAITKGKAAIVASWGGQAAAIFDPHANSHAADMRTAALRNAWNATWGVSIPANVEAERAVQTLETLMSLMGKDGDLLVTEIAGSPVRRSSYSDAEQAKYPWLGSQRALLESCRILPTDPAFAAYLGPLYSEVYNAFTGAKTAAQALASASKP